jgi:hypothetical protein
VGGWGGVSGGRRPPAAGLDKPELPLPTVVAVLPKVPRPAAAGPATATEGPAPGPGVVAGIETGAGSELAQGGCHGSNGLRRVRRRAQAQTCEPPTAASEGDTAREVCTRAGRGRPAARPAGTFPRQSSRRRRPPHGSLHAAAHALSPRLPASAPRLIAARQRQCDRRWLWGLGVGKDLLQVGGVEGGTQQLVEPRLPAPPGWSRSQGRRAVGLLGVPTLSSAPPIADNPHNQRPPYSIHQNMQL